eukprot:1116261-Prymnesium_polylepis.1
MLRKVYAAAMVESAKLGHIAPPLEPLFEPLIARESASLSLCTFDEMFDEAHDGVCMWVPDLGLALRVRPGMTPSAGADCSAPGISPCPLR